MYETYIEARLAASLHGEGGCAAAQACLARRNGEDEEQYLARIAGFNQARNGRDSAYSCQSPVAIAVYGDEGPTLTVAYDQAFGILEALGFITPERAGEAAIADPESLRVPELSGCVGAVDIQGRVLVAQALAPFDEGEPEGEMYVPGRAMVTRAGRAVGFLQACLSEIAKIANWAAERKLDVTWS
jgi:hypothetical protein